MKYLLLLLAFQAHGFSKKTPKPELPSTGTAKLNFPVKEWNDYALKEVQASKLLSINPVDAKEFCPNGMSANNWVNLLAAIVKYESNFKPSTTYKENFKNSRGEWVISTGLFQLSYESARGYGFSTTTEGLKDPYLNIKIAVKILEKWVVQDKRIASGSPYKGGSRYWSTLRPTGKLSSVKATLKPWCE